MKAKLVLHSGSLEGEERPLEVPETTIGRDPGRDIVFSDEADPQVSRVHATIHRETGETGADADRAGPEADASGRPRWFLVDEDSTNGTLVNGEPIEPWERVELSHGDEIAFGRDGPVGRFVLEPAETEVVPAPTRVAGRETEVYVGEGRETVLASPEARLEILSGGLEGETFPLPADGGEVTVGRAPDRDLAFSDEADTHVSREHAVIRHRKVQHTGSTDHDWYLVDAGSTNGTFVNGRRLEPWDETELADGDEITFGRDGPVARCVVKRPGPSAPRRAGTEIASTGDTTPTARGGTEPWRGAPAAGRSADKEETVPAGHEEPTAPFDEKEEEPVGAGAGDEFGPMWEEKTEPIDGDLPPTPRGSSRSGTSPWTDDDEPEKRPGDRTLIRKGTTWIMQNVMDWEEKLRLLYLRQKRKMWRAVAATAALGVVVSAIVWWRGRVQIEETSRQARVLIEEVEAQAHDAVVQLEAQVVTAERQLEATEAELARMETAWSVLREEQAQQLAELRERLGFTQAIAREYRASVAMVSSQLMGVAVATGAPVRFAVDANGEPLTDDEGNVVLTLEGNGPIVRVDACCGTAFLVHEDGWLLTNRHVLEATSFYGDVHSKLSDLVGEPVRPVFTNPRVYFPPGNLEREIEVEALHDEVDVGLARIRGSSVGRSPIPLAPPGTSVSVGSDVGAIGYPTASLLLCYRAEPVPPECEGAVGRTPEGRAVAVRSIDVSALARRGLVDPLVQRGTVSDVTGTEIVFNLTGSSAGGSSGSPVLDANRRVVGVNWAGGEFSDGRPGVRISRGVPIRYAWELLPEDVRQDLAAQAAGE